MGCYNEGIGIVGLTSMWPIVFNLKVIVIFQAAAELAATTTVPPTAATAPATTTAATAPTTTAATAATTTAVMWAGRAGAATETPPLTTPQNSGKRC